MGRNAYPCAYLSSSLVAALTPRAGAVWLNMWRKSEAAAVYLMAACALVVASGAVMLAGCWGGELPAPCDSLTLAKLTADCRTQVRSDCKRPNGVVDEDCATLKACSARIKAWKDCDGGAP